LIIRVTAREGGVSETRHLKRALRRMADQLAVGKDLELSVTLVSDEEIGLLNKVYLGGEGPTDVISFPLLTGEELAGAAARSRGRRRPEPIGDIVISVQTAGAQARERGHGLDRELELLAAHGMLHLFGYDHEDDAARRKMAEAERALLGRSIIGEATGDA
jgi:probable rRNA maturation factor